MPMPSSRAFFLVGALVSLLSLSSTTTLVTAKKDHNLPHPHRGILKAYSPGAFNVKLSRQDEATLAQGQSVMKQTMPSKDDVSGSAICIQDVMAPKECVWKQILDLDSYHGKVPKLNVAKNYFVGNNRDGTRTIKTKMVIGVMPGYAVRTVEETLCLHWIVIVLIRAASHMIVCLPCNTPPSQCTLPAIYITILLFHLLQYECYYEHKYYPRQSSLVWKLDYDKTSDFDDVSGHWHVESLPQSCSRVFYACDIKTKGSVPGPILNYISKQALKSATSWVKKESEAMPEAKAARSKALASTTGTTTTTTPIRRSPFSRFNPFRRQQHAPHTMASDGLDELAVQNVAH
jgi:hypothetical protein